MAMSRVVVIGATGHIGSYLVSRLVRGGHDVFALSRGTREPYHASPQWDLVTRVTVDREEQDAEGIFGARVAALRPDVVIEFGRRVGPEHAETTRQHTFRSITASIERARQTLGYAPRFSSLDALHEALTWLVANGQADVGGQLLPPPGSYG
jgi:nucleoside-diphosphate-sugar epimerase